MAKSSEEGWNALKRDGRGLGRLLDMCSNGVAMYSGNRLVQSNRAFQSLLDIDGDDLIGTSLESRFAPDVRDSTIRKLNEVLAAGLDHDVGTATRLQRSDGAEIYVDVSICLIEDSTDCVVVFRPPVQFRDSQRMNREELMAVSHSLRMAVFGELAASLLHELGQPLTAANGASELLLDQISRSADEEHGSRETAELVVESVTLAVAYFRRVWGFVRRRKPLIERIDVTAALSRTVELVKTAIRHAGIDLRVQTRDVAEIQADQALVQLVFAALLQRSVTALSSRAGDAGKIDIAVHQPTPAGVEVFIQHNGDVLPSEQHAIHGASEEDVPENYGQTLSACRRIIEENGGVLAVQTFRQPMSVCYRLIFPVA